MFFSGARRKKALKLEPKPMLAGLLTQARDDETTLTDSSVPAEAPSSNASMKRILRERPWSGRRSQRLHLELALVIYGHGPDQEPFCEETVTLEINASGALVTLATGVQPDQKLLVTNPKTGEEVACRVARMGRGPKGKAEIALEFLNPAPRFWRITFPPENWNPLERKRPVPVGA